MPSATSLSSGPGAESAPHPASARSSRTYYLFLPLTPLATRASSSTSSSFLRPLPRWELGCSVAFRSTQWAAKYSCFQNVGEPADTFPDLVLGPSGDAWTLDMLDLSFTNWLKTARPGALRGIQLGTLCLDHTKMDPDCSGGTGAAETGHPVCDKHPHGRAACGQLPLLSYRS